jgi:hypothetical protein
MVCCDLQPQQGGCEVWRAHCAALRGCVWIWAPAGGDAGALTRIVLLFLIHDERPVLRTPATHHCTVFSTASWLGVVWAGHAHVFLQAVCSRQTHLYRKLQRPQAHERSAPWLGLLQVHKQQARVQQLLCVWRLPSDRPHMEASHAS